MGKKSLTKSTTKKKTTSKKKATKKKAASASAKKTTSKSTTKKPTLKSLRKKQFDLWAPESLFKPDKDKDLDKQYSAPAVTDDFTKKEAKQISALLLKQFDLGDAKTESKPKKKAPSKTPAKKADKKTKAETKDTKPKAAPKKTAPAKKTAPKAAEKEPKKPKKQVSVTELLSMKFDAWAPKTLYKPETDADAANSFTAPALTDDYDAATADKIRSLLGKEFDLSVPDVPASAAPIESEAAAPPEAEQPVAEKDEKTEPESEPAEAAEPAPEPAVEETPQETTAPEAQKVEVAEQPAEPEAVEEVAAAPEADKPAEEAAPDAPEAAETPPPEGAAAPAASAEAAETVAESKQVEPEKAPAADAVAAEPEKPAAAEKPEKKEKPEKQKAEPPRKETPKKPSDGGGPPEPPEPPKPPTAEKKEPMDRGLMMFIGCFALIFVLIIGASINNMQKYYLKSTDDALEIWRGDFSPRGKHKIASLPGVEAPTPGQDVYSKKEALTPVFNFYMNKADALTEARDLLDFRAIKEYLNQAKAYAATKAQQQLVKQRLNRIDFMMLLYKADVSAEKGTKAGLNKAQKLLREATSLNNDPEQQQIVEKRISEIKENLKALKTKSQKPVEPTPRKPSAAEKSEPEKDAPAAAKAPDASGQKGGAKAAEPETSAAPDEKSADTETSGKRPPKEAPPEAEKGKTTYH